MRRLLSLLLAVALPAAIAAAPSTEPTVDAPTDALIHSALRYLASRQSPAGAWGFGDNDQAAITGYCLVAFLAAGELPGEGELGRPCARAVSFLLSCARPDGYIAAAVGQSNMYDHGIATIALGEVYGQTREESIRPKLERAIRLIIACQNAEGGWRYQPRVADADISVTVLQVVALRVARNDGIDVPQAVIDRAVKYVQSCRDPSSGGFGYQAQSRGTPGFARTAAAIYSLQVCGRYDDPMVADGSRYMDTQAAAWGQSKGAYFTYGNFYAAPAEYMIGGSEWQQWYARIKSMLVDPKVISHTPAGLSYWRPIEPQGVNEIYSTAVFATILSMPYGYLPLYQR